MHLLFNFSAFMARADFFEVGNCLMASKEFQLSVQNLNGSKITLIFDKSAKGLTVDAPPLLSVKVL